LIVRAAKSVRKDGDELISDLFEACSDLAFVHDPLDAAEFVADLVLDGIPSLAVLVSFFDINTREFVVVRQAVTRGAGEDLPNVVLTRASEFTPSIARTMRGGRSVVAMGAECVAVTTDPRWSALGIVPAAMISTPVELGGRFLGLVELCNPLDGGALRESDGHALTYIGEQFAEYLAQRETSVDPDYVRRPKLAQLARR
jgi:GAF domain-containing protein